MMQSKFLQAKNRQVGSQDHRPAAELALQVQAIANDFLANHLPDRFTADQPLLNPAEDTWQVPVILTYPHVGALGVVGTIEINPTTQQVLSHTPLEAMKQEGQKLYTQHRDVIHAHVP